MKSRCGVFWVSAKWGNDPCASTITYAWTLQSAEDVNKAGWIVGIGAWSGHGTFGYVLIPQTEVTK